ncbi:MAG: glycosyltransferase family 87 protein [Ktedonobacterales bacterium]
MQIPSPERSTNNPSDANNRHKRAREAAQSPGIASLFSQRRLNTLLLAIAIIIQLALLYVIRRYAAAPDGGDFCRDAVAMQRMLAGQTPYARVTTCGILFNVPHPPAYFLLIGPFAALPVAWGAALWDVVGLAALALSLALVARELRLAIPPALLALLLAGLIAWPPLLQTLLEAQVSPMLLLLVTLAWLWGRRGRSAWAGAALGVAAAVRLFPALAVVYFALRRDWRATLSAIAVFIGLELLATPMVGGIGGVRAYITTEAPASSAFWITHEHNVSLWGFTHLLFIGPRAVRPLVSAPWLASPLAYSMIGTLLVVLVARTWRNRQQSFAADECTFLAYIPLMLLASPLTWLHYFVMLLLPLVVLLANIRRGTKMARGLKATGNPAGQANRSTITALETIRGEHRMLILFALIEALLWITTAVDIAVASAPRPLPAAYGVLVYVLPTYALLLIYAVLLAPNAWRRGTVSRA